MTTETAIRPYKARALLFGLNYQYDSSSKLNGCINDVKNMASFLQSAFKLQPRECSIYTDDVDIASTSGIGIIQKLYEMAVLSHQENLDYVWIHYSGHGSYVRDRSGDEKDGQDECLVPSDYRTRGLLPDDTLNNLFRLFNPRTKVIFIFDCCHSGTIGDVRYSWEGGAASKPTVENAKCKAQAKVITISGCLDNQVSMDAYNVFGDNKFAGAMTACLLKALSENPAIGGNVFQVVDALRKKLKEGGYVQLPKLCSSHNLAEDASFLPC